MGVAQAAPPAPPSAGQIAISIEQVLLGSALAVGAATVGIVKWFVSRSIHEYETTVSVMQGKLEEVEGSLHNQQRTSDARASDMERKFVELNTKFVDREDYLKHQTTTDLKLDALHRRLDEMVGMMIRKQ